MAKHTKDKANPERYNLLKDGDNRMKIDGVSSLKYKIVEKIQTRLYTKISVSFDQNSIVKAANQTVPEDNKTTKSTSADNSINYKTTIIVKNITNTLSNSVNFSSNFTTNSTKITKLINVTTNNIIAKESS